MLNFLKISRQASIIIVLNKSEFRRKWNVSSVYRHFDDKFKANFNSIWQT